MFAGGAETPRVVAFVIPWTYVENSEFQPKE